MNDTLFSSAPQMAVASNYNDWTYRLLEPYVRGSVLEVGCGVGNFTRLLVENPRLNNLLSIDITPDAVEYCRRYLIHPKLALKCMDGKDVTGEFDNIVCMNVLEHIENDEYALRHLLSLLKPGGTLFLLVPSHPVLYNSFDREVGHFRRYTKKSMNDLLQKAAGSLASSAVAQFYFNIAGALGYFLVFNVLRKPPRKSVVGEIGLFDKWIVPVMRRIETRFLPVGLSLVTIITRGN